MSVSLIILNHNKAAYSAMLLDSLLASGGGPFEWLLVDNGSTDDTPAVLSAALERARAAGHTGQVMTFATNIGAIAGRNEAMKVAQGDVFAFLDNDLVVRDGDWCERLVAVLDNDPQVGIVSPKLVFPWAPYDIEFAGCDVTPGGRVIYRGRGEPLDAADYNEPRDCQCLISACIVFRRRLYDELGGLDEVFNPVQFEDLDFCYRAREAGWLCRYEPAVEMYHWEHTTTAGSKGVNFSLVTMRNSRTFKQRWGDRFAGEGGPPDELGKWRELTKHGLEEVPAPPFRR